jgi:hypothetical protein
MLMAGLIALLNAMGVAPTPQDLQNMQLKYRERGHHGFLDFGSTRTPNAPEGEPRKELTVGFGYEYYVDRQFHGVSFEAYGQKLGDMFKGPQDWWVGGGLGYHPIRPLKVFMHAGALFDEDEDGDKRTAAVGRVGVGFQLPFFAINVMPYAYVQTTDDGRFSWYLAARLEY